MEQQFFLSNPPYTPGKFMNPLELASNINKTSSYENLSLEEKVNRLEKGIENIQNSFPSVKDCKDVFFKTILDLMNNSENYMEDFYEESPDYYQNDSILSMMETLSWLSKSYDVKKELLDADLENYFSKDSPNET